MARGALGSIGPLEHRYSRDGNPVHVWNAIFQHDIATRILGGKLELAPWILANLVTAAGLIIGRAVAYPETVRTRKPKPQKNPDGTTTRYGSSYGGLSGAGRKTALLEALGFAVESGKTNPLAVARREEDELEFLRKYEKLRQDHLSVDDALARLKDLTVLAGVNDPKAKLRRI